MAGGPVLRPKARDLPEVIPPRSVFRLARSDAATPDWKADIGRVFRIGYYSPQDGLEMIWLVDEQGRYEQTTDRSALLEYFEAITISDESDLYGADRPELGPMEDDESG